MVGAGQFRRGMLTWGMKVGTGRRGMLTWGMKVGTGRRGMLTWGMKVGTGRRGMLTWGMKVGTGRRGMPGCGMKAGSGVKMRSGWKERLNPSGEKHHRSCRARVFLPWYPGSGVSPTQHSSARFSALFLAPAFRRWEKASGFPHFPQRASARLLEKASAIPLDCASW